MCFAQGNAALNIPVALIYPSLLLRCDIGCVSVAVMLSQEQAVYPPLENRPLDEGDVTVVQRFPSLSNYLAAARASGHNQIGRDAPASSRLKYQLDLA